MFFHGSSTPMLSLLALVVALLLSLTTVQAFAPSFVDHHRRATFVKFQSKQSLSPPPLSQLNMGFFSDKDRDKLTRESEPEEFFKTNTDKMTDQEKIPIAIAGIAFIALPFIAGLIALYASK